MHCIQRENDATEKVFREELLDKTPKSRNGSSRRQREFPGKHKNRKKEFRNLS